MRIKSSNTELTSGFDPNKIFHLTTEAGYDWADKKAAADLYEETKKTLIAKLANQANEKSEAAKERYAFSTAEYEDFVTKMNEARKEANKAKVKYDAAVTWSDNMRTLEANKRQEMKLSKGAP